MDIKMIPITKPYIEKDDLKFLNKVVDSKILTDGFFQKKCESIIKNKLKSKFVAITHSCTAALEISAMLINLSKNDEVILPSYGFVSIANAIVLRGARPIFAEIDPITLNISVLDVEKKITKKTKAIYVIHYAGNACDIIRLKKIAKANKLYLIEDAAHAYSAKFKSNYLGTLGDIGVYSFHETKNIVSGQGGCISINNPSLIKRANFILDKGTNRIEFINNYKKKIILSNNKKFYSWVDIGSEYRAPELSCALLYSQLKKLNKIQRSRKKIWQWFKKEIDKINSNEFYIIKPLKNSISSYHLFVIVFNKKNIARKFMNYMQKNKIAATFHYVPLHMSKMAMKIKKQKLKTSESIYSRIVRLPLFPGMNQKMLNKIVFNIKRFLDE
tara:strand:- start:826 stop:1983 length:1158 start_codon:yes stop_codon:yes gene_type:complete